MHRSLTVTDCVTATVSDLSIPDLGLSLMTTRTPPASVLRVRAALERLGHVDGICELSDSARTAQEAADALGIAVGQIASSIVFGLPHENGPLPLLVVTSGRHRVDTERVAALLEVPRLLRADADFVRRWSGFAIGGVSPLGWQPDADPGPDVTSPYRILIDEALGEWDEVWAAAGHTHWVFPTTFAELVRVTGGTPAVVGN